MANLHRQHGTEAEYIIIVKNNLQLPGGGGKTPSPTGGQFMVYGEGTLLTDGDGVGKSHPPLKY